MIKETVLKFVFTATIATSAYLVLHNYSDKQQANESQVKLSSTRNKSINPTIVKIEKTTEAIDLNVQDERSKESEQISPDTLAINNEAAAQDFVAKRLDFIQPQLKKKTIDFNSTIEPPGLNPALSITTIAIGPKEKSTDKRFINNNNITGSAPPTAEVSTITPSVVGIVYPLKTVTLVENNKSKALKHFKNTFIESAYAITCSALASIYELNASTSLPSTSAIKTSTIKSDASFSLDTSGLDLNHPNKYLLKISGCSEEYSRIITDFFSAQDVSYGTTLLAKVIELPTTNKVVALDQIKLNSISSRINHEEVNLESAYNQLASNAKAAQNFNTAFGDDISILTETKPVISNESVSVIVNEKTNNTYSLSSTHWFSSYDIIQEWYVDSIFMGTGANYTYSPGANDQGTHSLKTLIGKNNGSGRVNTTIPYEEKNWSITVLDTITASAPLISLDASNPTPILLNSLNLSINTGSTLSNCESFTSLAISETPMVPASSEFTLNCTTANAQIESYNFINTTDGAKTIYLWVMNSLGQISGLPSSVNLRKDTTPPTANLNNILGSVRGGVSLPITFSAADDNEISTIVLSYTTDGGTSYNNIVSLSAGSTNYNWSVPLLDSNNVLVRLRATDGAGKIVDQTTTSFIIDSTAPLAPSYTLNSSLITNNTDAQFTISNCTDVGNILINTGTLPLISDFSWNSCNTSIGHYHYTLANTEGAQAFSIWAKDISGNISASSTVNIIYDITDPSGSIQNLPGLVKGGDSFGLVFSSSDLNGIQSTSLSYTIDGINYSLIAANPTSPYTWTLPSVDSSSLRLKYEINDNAGNLQTLYSAISVLDSTPPSPHSIAIFSAGITNNTAILLTSSSCLDTPYILINEGTQPLEADASWQTCQTTAGAISHSITSVEGTHNLKAWFKDSAGNVSTANTSASLIYDVTAPSQSLNNLAVAIRGGNTTPITFTHSDLNALSSSKLQYANDGTTFIDLISNPT